MRSALMAGMALTLITLSGCGQDKTEPEKASAETTPMEAPAMAATTAITMVDEKAPHADANAGTPPVEGEVEPEQVIVTTDTEAQMTNRNELFDLLDKDLVQGAMPYMSKVLASGDEVEIWVGPIMGSADRLKCRFVMVGSIIDRRVEQSFPACREPGAEWTTTYDPATLGEAATEVIRAAFNGTMPAYGVGIDPYAPQ